MTVAPEPNYRVAVPAPRSSHASCACSSCSCCGGVRADLVDAALDVADAYMAGGAFWADMTRQQPLHPSMKRLLDSSDTLDHRHHRDELTSRATGAGGLFPAPVRTGD